LQPDNQTSVTWGSLKKTAEDAMRPLAQGTRVPVIVEEASYKKASTGSNMIVAKLAVFEGEYANRKLFNNFVLSPDSAFAVTMFFRTMNAFGITDQVFGELEKQPGDIESQLGIIADLLVNRKAWLTMGEPRTYQGVTRDNPGSFEAYPGQPAINLTAGLPISGGAVGAGPAHVPPVPQVASHANNAPVPGAGPIVGATPSVGTAPPVPPAPSF
jgi:Protein of unknown function (DUF669)